MNLLMNPMKPDAVGIVLLLLVSWLIYIYIPHLVGGQSYRMSILSMHIAVALKPAMGKQLDIIDMVLYVAFCYVHKYELSYM